MSRASLAVLALAVFAGCAPWTPRVRPDACETARRDGSVLARPGVRASRVVVFGGFRTPEEAQRAYAAAARGSIAAGVPVDNDPRSPCAR